MNRDTLKGQWKQLKGEAKKKWGNLTDDELDRVDGDAKKLEGQLQESYGYSKEEARKDVDSWLASR
jgi:uncharacterized protein YjbJ (UPF0337 family)